MSANDVANGNSNRHAYPHLYDTPPREVLLPAPRSRRRAGSDAADEGATTYYGRPMIKRPTWSWYIPLYFFVGGVAGGVGLIGSLAHFFGGREQRATVHHARYLAVALAALCPIPLIMDLGRPRRFFRMLRVFKVASPLSVGTWILSAYSGVSGALAARQAAEDGFVVPKRSGLARLILRLTPAGPLHALQAVFGVALGGYTGVLLAVTVVPLWAAAGILLGPLFLAASVTSGAAALALAGTLGGRQSRAARRQIETVANVGAAMQLGITLAHEVLISERIGRPLRRGRWGWLFRAGAVGGGMVLPVGLRLLARVSSPRAERRLAVAAATCTLLGTLAERFAIVEAGKVSADDPLAYQELTRGRPGAARPTAREQAAKVARRGRFGVGIAARDTAGGGDPGVR